MVDRLDLRASQFLRLLPPVEFRRVSHEAVLEAFAPGDLVQHHAGDPSVVFPLTAVFAALASEPGGGELAVAPLGAEGAGGLTDAFGGPGEETDLVCVIGGTAARVPAAEVVRLVETVAPLRRYLIRYLGARDAVMAQMAVCGRFHPLSARLARLLLDAHGRLGGRAFPTTHERLAVLLGVSRPKVSSAVEALRDSGLIATRPGEVELLDVAGMRRRACTCLEVVEGAVAGLQQPEAVGAM